jgi:hypothetical protein
VVKHPRRRLPRKRRQPVNALQKRAALNLFNFLKKMETIVTLLIGFVAGILVGRNNTRVVESVISFAKKIVGK